jgi:hypothetical protein
MFVNPQINVKHLTAFCVEQSDRKTLVCFLNSGTIAPEFTVRIIHLITATSVTNLEKNVGREIELVILTSLLRSWFWNS